MTCCAFEKAVSKRKKAVPKENRQSEGTSSAEEEAALHNKINYWAPNRYTTDADGRTRLNKGNPKETSIIIIKGNSGKSIKQRQWFRFESSMGELSKGRRAVLTFLGVPHIILVIGRHDWAAQQRLR